MIKKLGLSAAVILASVAMAQPTMAANWNNGERGRVEQRYDNRYDNRGAGEVRDYQRDNRYDNDRFERERFEHERFENRRYVRERRPAFGFSFSFGHDRW